MMTPNDDMGRPDQVSRTSVTSIDTFDPPASHHRPEAMRVGYWPYAVH